MHAQGAKIPVATEQLSPCVAATEPVHSGAHVPQRKIPHAATKTQCSLIKNSYILGVGSIVSRHLHFSRKETLDQGSLSQLVQGELKALPTTASLLEHSFSDTYLAFFPQQKQKSLEVKRICADMQLPVLGLLQF